VWTRIFGAWFPPHRASLTAVTRTQQVQSFGPAAFGHLPPATVAAGFKDPAPGSPSTHLEAVGVGPSFPSPGVLLAGQQLDRVDCQPRLGPIKASRLSQPTCSVSSRTGF